MSKELKDSSVFGTVVNQFFRETIFEDSFKAFLEAENISRKNGSIEVKETLKHFLENPTPQCTDSQLITAPPKLESPLTSKKEVSVTQKRLSTLALKPDNHTPSAVDKNWNCMEHILWINVIYFALVHLGAVYGTYLMFTTDSLKTICFALVYVNIGALGITAGAHRLWTHKAYKAKLSLSMFLAFCNSIAFQNTIYQWCWDHRLHHKYSETDADPHNSNRGFFFSHIGWLCCQRHPDVKRFGEKIDVSDLLKDPVVSYQRKYYVVFGIFCSFILPTAIPCYFWNESVRNAFFIAAAARYCASLHVTWLVNSAAHMYGYRPYDKSIAPAENRFVSSLALGEGYHNFHHTFPWDYSTSEWGWNLNITTMFLDIMAYLGLAYDMRKVTPEMIAARQARTGNNVSDEFHEGRKSELA